MMLWKKKEKFVSSDDPYAIDREMSAARDQAKAHWNSFCDSFAKRASNGDGDFSVRIKFCNGNVVERMWIAVNRIDGDIIKGTLASKPVFLHNFKLGQPVAASIDDLEDWLYQSGDDEFGGFTVMVLYRRELQKLYGLEPGSSNYSDAQRSVAQYWASLLNQQMAVASALDLGETETITMTYLLKINHLLCGNLGYEPKPDQLADATGLPAHALMAIWLFNDQRNSRGLF